MTVTRRKPGWVPSVFILGGPRPGRRLAAHRDEGGGCETRQLNRGRKEEKETVLEAKEVEGARKAEGGDGLVGYDAWPGEERQKWSHGPAGENHKGHERVCGWRRKWEGRVWPSSERDAWEGHGPAFCQSTGKGEEEEMQ